MTEFGLGIYLNYLRSQESVVDSVSRLCASFVHDFKTGPRVHLASYLVSVVGKPAEA